MSDPNHVILTVAADAARLPLARVVAVSCAALAGFPLDRIDDARQCTQEALALLLETCPGGEVELRFRMHSGQLEVQSSVACSLPEAIIDESSFAWLLLTELADDAGAHLTDDRLMVRFVMETREPTVLSTGTRT